MPSPSPNPSARAFIVGSHSTAFGRFPDRGFPDLTREAALGALADAGGLDGGAVGSAWFGNVLMGFSGQHSTRGQFCLAPLVEEGALRRRLAVWNVESGCATGSMALHGAMRDVLCGAADISLALGVEKTFRPDATPAENLAMFSAGENALAPGRTVAEYEKLAAQAGRPLTFGPDRTMFMDTYAMQAAWHMKVHGTTRRQIAAAAAKSHCNGALNPLAQYRFEMTTDQVLEDREVSWPLTRAMCAPVGDGAAAALVCSEAALAALPAAVRARAVEIRAAVLVSGAYRAPGEPSLAREAADRAYRLAGLGPQDVDLAELHDATAFGELYNCEMMRFCPIGEGGAFVGAGATALDGALPVNTSGGLISKGHPVGASGLSMTHEIVVQLRGEAGARQVRGARVGAVENGGGIMGLEEAACAVTLLAGPGS